MLNVDYQILGNRVYLVTLIRLVFSIITANPFTNMLLFNYLYHICTIIEPLMANVKTRLTNAF